MAAALTRAASRPVRHQAGRRARRATPRTQEHQLQRAVGALDLTALGLGAIIGTGIFVVIGEAIGDAGPAIILSFVLAGVTCVFSALCFAELASSIPVAGSAYTYTYATMGELIAWIIGWDLILEYAVSVAAVAVGWGQYFNDLLDSLFGVLPAGVARRPARRGRHSSTCRPSSSCSPSPPCSATASARAPARTRSWCSSSSRSSRSSSCSA